MYSSQNDIIGVLQAIYPDSRTVFRLIDVAMLTGETDFQSLNRSLNYFVRSGKLASPRKGIYAKPVFSYEEVANIICTPSYISLQYVLQREGVIFQYRSGITSVSYLSRTIKVGGSELSYRKIKDTVLVNTTGLLQKDNKINIATPERAFLDLLYLEGEFWFDNLNILNRNKVMKILPIYESKALTRRVIKLMKND
ncbi:MAG: hypothetical protein IH591_03105 [Bacteroidales bacterium]|nr:hypothetical protein [Bacteroidales bacterium]